MTTSVGREVGLSTWLRTHGPQDGGTRGPSGERVSPPATDEVDAAADLVLRRWQARVALAQTGPPSASPPVLALTVRDDLVLAEAVSGGLRRRTLLHADDVADLIAASTEVRAGGPLTSPLPDRALDPRDVAAGRVPTDVTTLLGSTRASYEAVFAVPGDEDARHLRPLVSCFVTANGVALLDARPRERSLVFRHRTARAAADLLAAMLRDRCT